MIDNPQNIFEQVQNEIATKLGTLSIFTGIQMPDGQPFEILTEDEGEPEFMFTNQIARAGLAVIVQSPTGKFDVRNDKILWFDPFVIAVSISEAILSNRADNGTKVRLMRATWAVIVALYEFVPPSLGRPLFPTRLLKDRDTRPDNDELVATRIVTFEANEAPLNLAST